MMASDFYESNLQKQRDCLIAETYKSEVILSTVISIKCRFDQMAFRSNAVLIKCRSINYRSIKFSPIGLRIKQPFVDSAYTTKKNS